TSGFRLPWFLIGNGKASAPGSATSPGLGWRGDSESSSSTTLGEAQQVVGDFSVGLRLQVVVAEAAHRHDHVDDRAAPPDVEAPPAGLNGVQPVWLRAGGVHAARGSWMGVLLRICTTSPRPSSGL